MLAPTDANEPFEAATPPAETSPVVNDPKALRCPPSSALILNLDQEDKLVTFCCERVSDMQKQNEEWIAQRTHWLNEHENNFKHRELAGTIYEKSNSSFNQSRRNAVPIIARLTRDFLGTDPFFACKPVRRAGSTVEADQIQNFTNYKLGSHAKGARLKESLEDAIEMAAVVGERVEMITFERDISLAKGKAIILVDENGDAVRTSRGEVIYDYDEWVDSSYFQQPPPPPPGEKSGQPAAPAKPFNLIDRLLKWGQPVAPKPIVIQPTGEIVLKKDPSIAVDPENAPGVGPAPTGTYKLTLFDKQDVAYCGPRVTGIHHGDFLCPLNAADIQSAPYIARIFDMTVPEIVEKYYMAVNVANLDPQEKLFYALLGEKLELLKGESAAPKSEETKADPHNQEQVADSGDKYNQVVKLAEVYLRADPDATGFQKEVMAVIVLEHKFALFYNYTSNITAPGVKRPFRVIRITPKRGRWYGISEYKLNHHKQNFIDWCLNQVVYDNSINGKWHFGNRDACEGWDQQEPAPGEKIHWLKSEFKTMPEKAMTTVAPPPMDSGLLDIMKNMMQSSQAERGNLSPGGDSLNQLPSSKLKYGIQAIQQAGDEIYALSAIHVERGLTEVTEACILTMMDNMDPVEEFEYTMGDQFFISQLNRSDIDQLDMNVSMEMTLTRGDQINEQNELAMNIVLQYKALMPCDQDDVRAFVIARLKSMDIQDVEQHVPAPDASDIQLSMQARRNQWQAMAQPPPPVGAPGSPAPASPPPPAPGPTVPPAKQI
jgi:hypothetical protein